MSKKERNTNFKVIQGRVVSDKMNKTRIIMIEKLKIHPIFKKAIRKSRRIKIHDERNESGVGDIVSAIETRPLSGEKRHRLFKIIKRSS